MAVMTAMQQIVRSVMLAKTKTNTFLVITKMAMVSLSKGGAQPLVLKTGFGVIVLL